MMRNSLVGTAWLMASLGLTSGAAQTVVKVWPGDMHGWMEWQETATGGFAFVNGPGTPPMGKGSASFVVDDTGGMAFGTLGYFGVPLSQITQLKYWTYRSSGSNALAVSLQLVIDPDLTDNSTVYFGRLVFEPYYTETVQTGVWQEWDTLTQGRWWFTDSNLANLTGCKQNAPCSWPQVLAKVPNIGIHPVYGGVLLKAGGGWTGGFSGNADALTIGILGQETTYDFELGPTNKEECKNGGWVGFFRNQGQCVSNFVSHRP